MLTPLVGLQQGNIKKQNKKMMKLVKIDEENLHIFQTTFNEIFRKNVSYMYGNIKSHKNPGLYTLSNLGNTIDEREVKLNPLARNCFGVNKRDVYEVF